MRMIVPDHCRPACSFGTIGSDQRRRIELEMPLGLPMHIGAMHEIEDRRAIAQQQPAPLTRPVAARIGADRIQQRP